MILKAKTTTLVGIIAIILVSVLVCSNCGVDPADHQNQTSVVLDIDAYISSLQSSRAGMASAAQLSLIPPRYDIMVRVTAPDMETPVDWFIYDYKLGDEHLIWIPSGVDRTFEMWLYETPAGTPKAGFFPATLHVTTTPAQDRTIDLVGELVVLNLSLEPHPLLSTVQTFNNEGYLHIFVGIIPYRIPGYGAAPCQIDLGVIFVDLDFGGLWLREMPLTVGPGNGEYFVANVPAGRNIAMIVWNRYAGWLGRSADTLILDQPNPVNVWCLGWKDIKVEPANVAVADGLTPQLIGFVATGGFGEYNFSHTLNDFYAQIHPTNGQYNVTGTLGSDSVDRIFATDACGLTGTVSANAYWYVAPHLDFIRPDISFMSGGGVADIYGSGFDATSQAYIGSTMADTMFMADWWLQAVIPPVIFPGYYNVRVLNPKSNVNLPGFTGFESVLYRSFRYIINLPALTSMNETEFNDGMPFCNKVGINTTVYGQIADRFDVDNYCLPINPVRELAIWLDAESEGSPLDGNLLFLENMGIAAQTAGSGAGVAAQSGPTPPNWSVFQEEDDSYSSLDPVLLIDDGYLVPGIYGISVSSSWRNSKGPPYGPQGGEGYSYTLRIAPAVKLKGTVYSSLLGPPEPNAQMAYYSGTIMEERWSATDVNGYYEAVVPPFPGIWQVSFKGTGDRVGIGVFTVSEYTNLVDKNVYLRWDLADDCVVNKKGMLFFSDGTPAPRAPVSYSSLFATWLGSVATGSGASSGEYHVTAAIGAGGVKQGPLQIDLPDGSQRYVSVTDCTSDLPDLYLMPLAAIQGRVIDSSTLPVNPVPNAEVVAVDSEGKSVNVQADINGYYFLMGKLAPGPVTVWAGGFSTFGSIQVNLTSPDQYLLNQVIDANRMIVYETDYISGEIFYPGSPPAMGFKVEASKIMWPNDWDETDYSSGYQDYTSHGGYYLPNGAVASLFTRGPFELKAYDYFSYYLTGFDWLATHPYLAWNLDAHSTFKTINVDRRLPVADITLLNTIPRCIDGYDNDLNGRIDYQPNWITSDDVTEFGMSAGACCFAAQTVIIRPGWNLRLETRPRGDDEILYGNIVVGADGQVNTTVKGDPNCESVEDPFEFPATCNDGKDNDLDMLIDYQDAYVDDEILFTPGQAGLSPYEPIICSGNNGVLETQQRGDDMIVGDCIVAGPNGEVNTTADGDPDCGSIEDPFEENIDGTPLP